MWEAKNLKKVAKLPHLTVQDDKIPVVSRNGWFMHGRNSALQPSLKILDFFPEILDFFEKIEHFY